MLKQKARKGCGASDLSLTKPHPNNNKNIPPILRDFSSTHLNELWLTAARLGEEDICREIEEVRFERLEREREKYYDQHCN